MKPPAKNTAISGLTAGHPKIKNGNFKNMETNKIYNCDNLDLMKEIPNESINVILTDPPYLYLKNQKLDRPFDENLFFSECKRILKKDGFIVLFGRGSSFYRWNTMLADLEFIFKEEIIWNKRRVSSPCSSIGRIHETVSIHSLGNSIKKVYVNYGELKGYDLHKITEELKRLGSVFNKSAQFEKIIYNIQKKYEGEKPIKQEGKNTFKTTINSQPVERNVNTQVIYSMLEGSREQSIIEENRKHIKQIHPTQKPVRLLERILALVSKENDIILDSFAGSCSTAITCINSNRQYICCEIDEEYYTDACKRVQEHQSNRQKEVEQTILFDYNL
jgi:site-specific DNA-methyltransferase (adenine-specific)